MLDNRTLTETLKMAVLFVLVIYFVKMACYKTGILGEHFSPYPSDFKANSSPESMHDILTKDCKPEYCAAHIWNRDQLDPLPQDYDVANISTSTGCCIIPIELKRKMYETRGNEEKHY